MSGASFDAAKKRWRDIAQRDNGQRTKAEGANNGMYGSF